MCSISTLSSQANGTQAAAETISCFPGRRSIGSYLIRPPFGLCVGLGHIAIFHGLDTNGGSVEPPFVLLSGCAHPFGDSKNQQWGARDICPKTNTNSPCPVILLRLIAKILQNAFTVRSLLQQVPSFGGQPKVYAQGVVRVRYYGSDLVQRCVSVEYGSRYPFYGCRQPNRNALWPAPGSSVLTKSTVDSPMRGEPDNTVLLSLERKPVPPSAMAQADKSVHCKVAVKNSLPPRAFVCDAFVYQPNNLDYSQNSKCHGRAVGVIQIKLHNIPKLLTNCGLPGFQSDCNLQRLRKRFVNVVQITDDEYYSPKVFKRVWRQVYWKSHEGSPKMYGNEPVVKYWAGSRHCGSNAGLGSVFSHRQNMAVH